MGKKNAKQGEMDLLRCLQIAAHRRALALGISSTDYLIGILEGVFPKITTEELLAARQSQREHGSISKAN
jgi:hypothetical protein